MRRQSWLLLREICARDRGLEPCRRGRCPRYRGSVPVPVVAKLWIAAAERAIDEETAWCPDDLMDALRSRLRAAAVAAEDLLNVIAGPRGSERTAAIDVLVERFGDCAADVGFIAAAFIVEAVTAASVEHGIDAAEAERVADCCGGAVIEASAALDSISTLVGAQALLA